MVSVRYTEPEILELLRRTLRPEGYRIELVLADIQGTTTLDLVIGLRRCTAGQIEEQLSPRLRQTLQVLMTGASEKQLAEKLGISQHTAHQYVKTLFRRYEVSSRAELMAKVGGR